MMRDEDRRNRPPVPGWIGAIGEPVYRAAVTLRNARFNRGWGVRRFPIPVVSVGNLSVGGTGKTPMVAMIVRMLLDAGKRPAIVMRGYKSEHGADGVSDEMAEYAAMFGERVPVVADPDRRRAIGELVTRRVAMGGSIESGGLGRSGTAVSGDGASSGTGLGVAGSETVDCVVLDDGFQHRRVARDLDVVLIDASRDVFADRLLPRGWLREPVGSLARAGVVVLTHADVLDEAGRERVRRRVAEISPGAGWVEACHGWAGLRVFERGAERAEPVEWLRGRAVVVSPGIGNPSAFSAQVRDAGADVVWEEFWPDHHHWKQADAQGLIDDAGRPDLGNWSCIVTTMKDWVKIRSLVPDSRVAWCVPVLEMRVVRGGDELRERVMGSLAARVV